MNSALVSRRSRPSVTTTRTTVGQGHGRLNFTYTPQWQCRTTLYIQFSLANLNASEETAGQVLGNDPGQEAEQQRAVRHAILPAVHRVTVPYQLPELLHLQ